MDNTAKRIDLSPPRPYAVPAEFPLTEAESAWFRHFNSLGLSPEHITKTVTAGGKTYYPHFWIANWNAFVYVINEREDWKWSDIATISEADDLMNNIQQFDVIVLMGLPHSHARRNVILLSYPLSCHFARTERPSLLDVEWTVAGIFDVKNTSGLLWLLYSDAAADVYLPNEQTWCQICECKEPTCADCNDFRVFYPVVSIEPVITDPFVGKEPHRRKPKAL
jgi:hypothetical protein